MTIRKIVISIIVGVGAVLSVRALATVALRPVSYTVMFELIAGPAAVFLLTKRRFWLQLLVGIAAFAGVVGFAVTGTHFAEALIYDVSTPYGASTFAVQAALSSCYLAVYAGWLWASKKRNADEG